MRTYAILMLGSVLAAQEPRIENAKLEQRSGAQGLLAAVEAASAVTGWIAYSVPAVKGEHTSCCDQTCRLEGPNSGAMVALEGSAWLVVALRLEQKRIHKVRMFSETCTLDAGGRPFTWLTGVVPSESVAFLKQLSRDGTDRDGAIAAIAQHATTAADAALDEMLGAAQPDDLRRKAMFWLGEARGHHGYESLQRLLHSDANDGLREHAVFALSLNNDKDALRAIVQTAHDDRSAHVRGQALFWLAQKAGAKMAAQEILNAIENDPDTDVKKKAVFALSQMSRDEGVPRLIEVAKTNHNREVRKQAMFWLGQSQDSRALDFMEQVLLR